MASPPKLQGYVDGMKVYEYYVDCPVCNDTGFVSILHPIDIWLIKKNKLKDVSKHQWRSCAVVCWCEVGLRKDVQRLPVWNSQKWHIARNDQDFVAKAALYEHRPPGFNEEFADYA